MKIRILFALLLIVTAAAGFGATTVKGKVVAADGTTPYPDVEVTVLGVNETVYTDADGDFFVRNLTPGEYVITVKTSRSKTNHKIVALAQPVTPVKIAVK
jgi:hypothetical protein